MTPPSDKCDLSKLSVEDVSGFDLAILEHLEELYQSGDRRVLWTECRNNGIDSFPLSNGRFVTVTNQVIVKPLRGRKRDGQDWLRNAGYEYILTPDETIDHNIVRLLFEEGMLPDFPKELFFTLVKPRFFETDN